MPSSEEKDDIQHPCSQEKEAMLPAEEGAGIFERQNRDLGSILGKPQGGTESSGHKTSTQ